MTPEQQAVIEEAEEEIAAYDKDMRDYHEGMTSEFPDTVSPDTLRDLLTLAKDLEEENKRLQIGLSNRKESLQLKMDCFKAGFNAGLRERPETQGETFIKEGEGNERP